MTVTNSSIESLCRELLSDKPHGISPADYVRDIPNLNSLRTVPRGTPVLVRGDVDARPGSDVSDSRLESMKKTLEFGRDRGWKQIIFGHCGREESASLDGVADRLSELLGFQVPLVSGWYDEATQSVPGRVSKLITNSGDGTVMMLENVRRYKVERLLWDANAEQLPEVAGRLTRMGNEMREKIASIYINEAFSAGSLDTSTTIVPMAMQRVALGSHVAAELAGPVMACREAELVVFAGEKADKLDDLESIVERDKVKVIIAAGSLAIPLKRAAAELDGATFDMGLAGDPTCKHSVSRQRIAQAIELIRTGRANGVRFVMPIDFTLQDGRTSPQIGPGNRQFDIGPDTSIVFNQEIDRFKLSRTNSRTVFYNGVFGMCEEERFSHGTRRFMPQLKRLNDAGVRVFVGGGSASQALERFGRRDWVTHCFNAGGTVLNALGTRAIPYLLAMRSASRTDQSQ